MLGRRLLVLVAVLLGLAAVTTSLAPREAAQTQPASRAPALQPQAEPRATDRGSNVGATVDVPSEPPLVTLDSQRTRQRVQVRVGRRTRLAVKSTELGSVQIGVDGPIEAIDPDSPARFDLLYASPRRLEILARDGAGGPPRPIGRLDVLPAL